MDIYKLGDLVMFFIFAMACIGLHHMAGLVPLAHGGLKVHMRTSFLVSHTVRSPEY